MQISIRYFTKCRISTVQLVSISSANWMLSLTSCPNKIYWSFNFLINLLIENNSKFVTIIYMHMNVNICRFATRVKLLWQFEFDCVRVLSQKSSDSHKDSAQAQPSPAINHWSRKNHYRYYCYNWQNPVYRKPSNFCVWVKDHFKSHL